MFDEIGEFFSELNSWGILLGLGATGFIFVLRKIMLYPFLEHMSPPTAIFWGAATYVLTAVVGYYIGVKMSDN